MKLESMLALPREFGSFLAGLFGGEKASSVRSMSIVDHIFIIRAILLRNLRLKYHRRPGGIFLEFLQPSVVCILHYYLFRLINKAIPAGIEMEEFVWGGFIVWFAFSHVLFSLQRRLPPRPPLPGVTLMHVRVATAIWPLLVNALFCYVSFALLLLFGDNVRFPNVPLTALVLFLAGTFGFGWGLVAEGFSRVMPLLDPIFHFLPWLVFLSSGIYFSLANVPQEMAVIDVYNPLLHLLEYQRAAFDPGYPKSMLNLPYAATCSAVLLFVGLLVNRSFRHAAHR